MWREVHLGSGDTPRPSLAAAKYILQGTRLLSDTKLPIGGPTTPEGVIMDELQTDARNELEAEGKGRDPFKVDLLGIDDGVEALAERRLMKAMAEAGLA